MDLLSTLNNNKTPQERDWGKGLFPGTLCYTTWVASPLRKCPLWGAPSLYRGFLPTLPLQHLQQSSYTEWSVKVCLGITTPFPTQGDVRPERDWQWDLAWTLTRVMGGPKSIQITEPPSLGIHLFIQARSGEMCTYVKGIFSSCPHFSTVLVTCMSES